MARKLFKSFFVYSIVSTLPLAWSVILLPFYTNLLSTSDFGTLALYTGFTFFIQILANFGFDSYVTVHFIEYQNDRRKLKECMGTLVSILFIWSGVIVVFFLAAGQGLFHFLFRGSSLSFFPYGFMSVLTAVFNSAFKTYTNLLIFRQQPGRFFWLNLINFVLTIGISIAGLYLFPYSLVGPMWGRLLSGAGIFLVSVGFLIAEFGFDLKPFFFSTMIRFCYPIVIYSLLVWILSYVDRFIINHFMLTRDVAVYDFAVKCTLLLEFFQYGVANAISPKIYEIWRKENRPESSASVNRYYSIFSASMLFVIPIFVFIVPVLVPFIVKQKEYYAGLKYLSILSIGYATKALFYMYLAPFSFFKKTRLLPKAFLFSAVGQIAATVAMVRAWGLAGAVWASLLSKILQVFFLRLEARKIFRFQFNETKLVWLPAGFMLLTILAGLWVDMTRYDYQVVNILAVCLGIAIAYRKELVFFLEQFRKKAA
jgi:O-antigen/teichoic acid export membrane protein